jgi:hypothetical protein
VAVSDRLGGIFWEITYDSFIISSRFLMFIRDMGLVYLIAEYENFVHNTLEVTFSVKPEILSTSKKSVTFEELMKFENLESVKDEIIGKEACEICNKDIEEIQDYFQNRLNINIKENGEWEKI